MSFQLLCLYVTAHLPPTLSLYSSLSRYLFWDLYITPAIRVSSLNRLEMYSLMWKAAALLGALSFHISATASDLVLPGADGGQNSVEITQGRSNRELRRQLSKNASIHFTSSPQFGNLVCQSYIPLLLAHSNNALHYA